MNGRRALSALLLFVLGFLCALAMTATVGFAVMAVLTAIEPQWKAKWAMAGAIEKTWWVAVPNSVLLGGVVLWLWNKRRALALGVLAYALADAAIALLG